MKNKIVEDEYTINQPYTIKHVSSDILQMSCYGYDFVKWTDGGNTFNAGSSYTFQTETKEVSAVWQKHNFLVRFWKEKNIQSQTIHAEYLVPYEDSCTIPSNPTAPYKTKFSRWEVQGGSSYKIEDLSKVSCDMDIIAEFVKQWYVTFKYMNDDTERSLCQLTCDDNDSISREEYPPLEKLQKRFYTISSFNPESVENVTHDTTIFVIDTPNTIQAKYSETNFTYDKSPHSVQVEEITKTPQLPGDVIVKYTEDGHNWTTQPISKTSIGNYQLSIGLSSENYFEKIYPITLIISDPGSKNFYFKDYLNADGQLTTTFVPVALRFPVPVDVRPQPKSTNAVTFVGWYPEENLEDPTETNNYVSAIYRTNKYTASYYWDDTIPEYSGGQKVNEDVTVDYGGNAYRTSPSYKKVGSGEYKCDGWFQYSTERNPSLRIPIGNEELSNLVKNISAYAFMRKIHPLNLYNVVDGVTHISSLPQDMSSVIDYEYLMSSDIGISQIEGHSFQQWYPPTDSQGRWLIDRDNYSISAIYKSDTGILTYHSHYPTITN